ncbi:alpha/beta hydrolase [Phycisphaeraceae bacterium D3-23]
MAVLILHLWLAASPALAENEAPPVEVVYKQVVDAEGEPYDLRLHIFYPEGWSADDARPAIVFYFGGGWNGGQPEQFFPHCRDLAAHGMVAISADYRVRSRHGTSPIACVEDGRSAIRYLRAHADELGIDVDRVIAGGGSAGGHVAAASALCDDINDPADDAEVSATPNALVLFNPVLDTSRQSGFGGNRLGDDHLRLSPVHRVSQGQPASIVFHGDADRTVPISVARRFAEACEGVGARSELVEYEGQPHGFFNHPAFRRGNDLSVYTDTIERTVTFLRSLDLLEPAEADQPGD